MFYFWLFLYNIFYPFLFLTAMIFSLFSLKVRESILGKFKSLSVIRTNSNLFNRGNDIYWFHVSSLGEYFQITSVLKSLREINSRIKIVVSFTSSSGYNNARDDLFDLKFYLPFDFIWIIGKTLNIIKPKKIVFSSYDIWFNFLFLAKFRNIETTLTSLVIDDNSNKLNQIIKSFYKTIYKNLDFIHVVTERDKKNLEIILGLNGHNTKVLVSGNPRVDYVYDEFQNTSEDVQKLKILKRENIIIIASTHDKDDEIVIPGLIKTHNKFPNWKIIYVPHDPIKKKNNKIKLMFNRSNKDVKIISDGNLSFPENKTYLISSVGLLAKLYWIAKIAYVGGGFSTGIHNIMEPSIASLPIIIGPKYNNSPEAEELLKNGGAVSINDSIEFSFFLEELIEDKEKLYQKSKTSKRTIEANLGATNRIIKDLTNE